MSTVAIRERPILFSGEMVRAILDGRKTQTRRVVKPQPSDVDGATCFLMGDDLRSDGRDKIIPCPYGQPGDRLWVRETWCPVDDREHGGEEWVDYRATPKYEASHPAGWENAPGDSEALKWRSSIHMPRNRSRITLEITEVRVQRLTELSAEDVRAEGVKLPVAAIGEKSPGKGIPLLRLSGPTMLEAFSDRHPRDWTEDDFWRFEYANLWDTLNAKRGYSWESNPWVWCLTFRPVLGSPR